MRSGAARLVAGVSLLLLLLGLSLKDYDSFQLGTYQDDAKYVVLARSIAFAKPYSLSVGPGTPLPTGYPFVFPLLLAPFTKLFPDAPETMKVLSLVATLVSVSLLLWGWPLLSPTTSRWWGVGVAGCWAVAPNVVGQTRMVMSDALFTTFVLATLLLVEHCARRGGRASGCSIALGLSMTLALFTRTVGVVLCLAVMLRLCRLPGRRFLEHVVGILVGGAAVLVPVLLCTTVTPANLVPFRYLGTFRQPSVRGVDAAEDVLAVRFARGVREYAQRQLREIVVPFGGGRRETAFGQGLGMSDLPSAIGLLVTGLVVLGCLSQLFGGGLAPSVLLFEVPYVTAILFWHYRSSRFLYPIQPFLLDQLFTGVGVLGARVLPRTARAGRLGNVFVGGAFTVITCGAVYKDVQPADDSRQHARDFRVGTSWLKDHSAPDAVVMAQQSPAIHLYSDRRIVDYPAVRSASELEQALRDLGVNYILVAPDLTWRVDVAPRYDDYTSGTFLPFVEALATAGKLTLVYESDPKDRVCIYRVEAMAAP